LARKILLADDSVTAQNMGRRILLDAGYEVFTVNNGSAALKRIAEAKPDLIVLDVYMPGYGGLEVCQRIREAPETARIPVLLTVGKLEPFKPEDARRVRADAYIIKPFEASELLTALTKLEDRIVPQPQAHKAGRFAKAIASIEDSAKLGNEFGDIDTGWKNRLKIPPPHPKHEPREDHSQPPKQDSKGDSAGEIASAAAAAVPADATQEEIAAIAAAAAALAAQEQQGRQENQSASEVAKTPKPVVATETSGSDSAEAAAQSASSFAVAETPSAAESVGGEVHEVVASSDVAAAVAMEADCKASNEQATTEIKPSSTSEERTGLEEHEVDAALATLGPSHGKGTESDAQTETSAQVSEPVPVTMAAMQEFSGPRWIAEPASLTENESTLILEEEMRKAYAALSAMESGESLGDSAQVSAQSPIADPGDQTTSSSEDTIPVGSPTSLAELGQQLSEWVASAEQSADNSQVFSQAALANLDHESVPSEVKEQAMAAAAASFGTAESTAVSEASLPAQARSESAESSAPTFEGRTQQAELAAAWAQWKSEREAQPETKSAVAGNESVAAVQPETPQQSAETAKDGAEDQSAIASIVDSLLADLKPKLMEEIARKMGKDSKKK
jgi:CheY-like chemotaxis protein